MQSRYIRISLYVNNDIAWNSLRLEVNRRTSRKGIREPKSVMEVPGQRLSIQNGADVAWGIVKSMPCFARLKQL